MDILSLSRPWTEVVLEQVPGLELFDAHTHLGQNDPDGMKQTPEELLDDARARPTREARSCSRCTSLTATRRRTTWCIASGGRSRRPARPVLPRQPARRCRVAEAERCLDAGARGIKLHPRAEQFTLDHPAVRTLVALAHERRLPMLIHAGRGIPALGLHAVELAGDFPDARLILAHAGDLRSLLDLARCPRPSQPAVRHRMVDAGRPADAVRARARRARSCSPPTLPTAPPGCRPSSAPLRAPGRASRRSRSARSPPSSRCGSPPASRCSPPARQSASVSGRRTCCSIASPSS